MIKQNNNLTYIYETEFSNDNNILFEKNSLNILNVEYGTIDTYINVTNKAKEIFLKDNYFFISKKINLNNIFGDPCYGIQKVIKINALINNTPIYICKQEINGYLEDDIVLCEKNDLVILNVEYGCNNTYINVTNKVKELYLKNNNLILLKKINLNDIFGDTCSGIQKELKIDVLINNKYVCICEKEINGYLENDIIIICEINNLDFFNNPKILCFVIFYKNKIISY